MTNVSIASSRLPMDPNNASSQLPMDPKSVTVTFSWTGPSTRNGLYNYTLTYRGVQDGDYPSQRMKSQNETISINDSMMEGSMSISGLPYANYTINVTAINIKTGRPGPSSLYTDRTIIIGKDEW